MQVTTSHKCIDQIPGQTTGYRIDADATVHVTRILRNMYAEPVKAVLREYVANAIDSHRQAKVTDPVQVHLPTEFDPTFSVTDKGTGLSHENFNHLILGYGSSGEHKRAAATSAEQIGGFGIGCKSMFSITDSFTYEVWFDGEERKYLCYLDDNDMGQSKLLYRKPTTHANGMRVSAPVKRELLRAFADSVTPALCWFTDAIEVLPAESFVSMRNVQPDLTNAKEFKLGEPPVACSWRLYSSETAAKVIPFRYDSQYQFRVNMGGIAYEVRDPQLDSLIVNSIPRHHLLVLDAPINTFELAPTRETLQSTRKTVRLLSDFLTRFRDSLLPEALQPAIDAEEDIQSAATKYVKLTRALGRETQSTFKYRGQKISAPKHFIIPLEDILETHDVHFLSRSWAPRRHKLQACLPQCSFEGVTIVDTASAPCGWRRYEGVKPGVYTGLLPGNHRAQTTNVAYFKENDDIKHLCFFITLADRQQPVVFLTGDLPNPKHTSRYISGEMMSVRGAIYIWIRKDPEGFFKKYPWLRRVTESVVDLTSVTWAPAPPAPRVRATAGTATAGKTTMPAGIYVMNDTGPDSNKASSAWELASLKELDTTKPFYYMLIDKFAPLESIAAEMGMKYASPESKMRVVLKMKLAHHEIFGEPVNIYGIKHTEQERLDKVIKAGATPVPVKELWTKLVTRLCSPEAIATHMNVYGAFWRNSQTDHDELVAYYMRREKHKSAHNRDLALLLVLRLCRRFHPFRNRMNGLSVLTLNPDLEKRVKAFRSLVSAKLGKEIPTTENWSEFMNETCLIERSELPEGILVNGVAMPEKFTSYVTTHSRQTLSVSAFLADGLFEYIKPLVDMLVDDPQLSLLVGHAVSDGAMAETLMECRSWVRVDTGKRDWLASWLVSAFEQTNKETV